MDDYTQWYSSQGGLGYSGGVGSVSYGLGAMLNNLKGTTAQNSFNSAEAQKARDFEMLMSNTAYQRAKADMDAAGINPASLTSSGGAGPASTPSGHSAQAAANQGGLVSTVLKAAMIAASKGLAAKMTSGAMVAAADKRSSVIDKVSKDAKTEINAAKEAAWENEVQRVQLKNKEREWKLLHPED